jgi:membrane associated rhomboid family serine protease
MSVTLLIIIFTCLVSWQGFNNPEIIEKLKHYPFSEHRYKEYYRWVSSGFVHANFFHLFLNMFVLWQFGGVVEHLYQGIFGEWGGRFFFLLMYISSIAVADIPTYRKYKDSAYYPGAVGASGAVSAVTFAFILFYPWSKLYFYMAIPIPAILFGILYLLYEQWASKNQNDNIGHDAHFAGAIYGILFTIVLQPSIFMEFIQQVLYNSPYW